MFAPEGDGTVHVKVMPKADNLFIQSDITASILIEGIVLLQINWEHISHIGWSKCPSVSEKTSQRAVVMALQQFQTVLAQHAKVQEPKPMSICKSKDKDMWDKIYISGSKKCKTKLLCVDGLKFS